MELQNDFFEEVIGKFEMLQHFLFALMLGLLVGVSGCGKDKTGDVDYSSGLRLGEDEKEYPELTVPTIGPFECTEYGVPTDAFKPYVVELKETIPANKEYFFKGGFDTFNGKSAPCNVYIQILRSVNGELELVDQLIGNTKFYKPRALADTSTFSFKAKRLKRGKYVAKIWNLPSNPKGNHLFWTFTFHVD